MNMIFVLQSFCSKHTYYSHRSCALDGKIVSRRPRTSKYLKTRPRTLGRDNFDSHITLLVFLTTKEKRHVCAIKSHFGERGREKANPQFAMKAEGQRRRGNTKSTKTEGVTSAVNAKERLARLILRSDQTRLPPQE